MLKKILIISTTVIIVVGIVGAFGFYKFKEMNHPYLGINPQKLSKAVTEKELEKHHSELERIWGFCGKDISEKDISQISLNSISNISFDQKTKWPEETNLPKDFNSNSWLQIGKDPGLNLNKIHEKGITGKGVSVAVIDKSILENHNEFKDRMTYIKCGQQTGEHFHGMACASILAGETCGVAKDAKLYYFSNADSSNKFSSYYTQAVDKIIEINKSLLKKEKIKIASISDGFSKESGSEWNTWTETLKRAQAEGLTVVYSNSLSKKKFTWGGCPPSKDRNNPSNYKLSSYLKGSKMENDKSWILVPGDFRTTASNNGIDQYVYWGEGGYSWAIPYVTGLATLAWQINPNLSFDEIINKLVETKTVTSEGRYIINPESFIRAINK